MIIINFERFNYVDLLLAVSIFQKADLPKTLPPPKQRSSVVYSPSAGPLKCLSYSPEYYSVNYTEYSQEMESMAIAVAQCLAIRTASH